MVVEYTDYHRGVVEKDVKDYGCDPDEHRTEQGSHPEYCLEIKTPHDELKAIISLESYLRNVDIRFEARACILGFFNLFLKSPRLRKLD